MKKLVVILMVSTLICSCKKSDANVKTVSKVVIDSTAATTKDKKFEMYQMSEMAALMEQMYAHNSNIRTKILNGEAIKGKLPDFFQKIHAAKFTDASDNDLFFKQNAALFLDAQELIYTNPNNTKEHYNAGIDACIVCHKSKCGGPIPRIKKLYIK